VLRRWRGFRLAALAVSPLSWPAFCPCLLSPRYLGFIRNSLTLAGIAAVVTVACAILLGSLHRIKGSGLSAASLYVGRLGYAVPGGVIAVGLIVPFAFFDNTLDAWMRATFDISTGLLVTGSIGLLITAYMIRFLAAAIGAYDGSIATVGPNIDAAARTLGAGVPGLVGRVHLPIDHAPVQLRHIGCAGASVGI